MNSGVDAGHGMPSATYRSLTKLSTRSVTRYKSTSKLTNIQNIRKGIEEYESSTLKMNENTCKGFLMKRIDQRKLYHRSNFHKRFFDLRFSQAMILIKVGDVADAHKKIPIESIRACTM